MKYTEIKSFEDACKAQNIDPNTLPDVSNLPAEIGEWVVNNYKIAIVAQAINGDWKADFGDHEQEKYFPYFYSEEGYKPGSGSGFSFGDFGFTCTDSSVGARLCYESYEKAKYASKTFIELYEMVHLK